MLPFDSYPKQGRALLGIVNGNNMRHIYGLRFMQMTGQTCCAYCGWNLVQSYETWLSMQLDHVVPSSVCKRFSLPKLWVDDCTNRVLACPGCNGFDNRYPLPADVMCPQTSEEFFNLRDMVFEQRKQRIAAKDKKEREFFAQRLWENRE